jgi:pimeloyl-ACP methyl ester carboxylesterase
MIQIVRNGRNQMRTGESAAVVTADYIEAGNGPLVVLVHSSMAGARQWSGLIRALSEGHRVRAVNLFGYGGTPSWPGAEPPTLDDFAELVVQAVPRNERHVRLVGHSFGGAVAMQVAAHRLRGQVDRLVLIEPSLFHLLDDGEDRSAYREILSLSHETRGLIAAGELQLAAERFIDYWCGDGAWATNSPERMALFAGQIRLLANEWNAALGGSGDAAEWARLLPSQTMLVAGANTTRPAQAILERLWENRPEWDFASIHDAGHMAPVTHPEVVNPLIRRFLTVSADTLPVSMEVMSAA